MNDSTHSRVLLASALIQALSAALSIILFFLGQPDARRLVGWLLVPAIATLIYARVRSPVRASARAEPIGPTKSDAHREPLKPSLRALRIGRIAVFACWSVVGSAVAIDLSTFNGGFFMIALGPLWIGLGGFIAAWVARDHKPSALLLGGLLCGSFGAWLGSAGTTGTLFGFIWGGLSGILAAGYFVDTNPFVNLWVAILGTGVFFCAVDYLLRPYVSFLDLAHYVRNGFPVLALESMVLISGYSLTKLIRLLRAPK